MSVSSLRKIYALLPRHIQPGGRFDQFHMLLNGCVCGLWKNDCVSMICWSVHFIFLRAFCQKVFLIKKYVLLVNHK